MYKTFVLSKCIPKRNLVILVKTVFEWIAVVLFIPFKKLPVIRPSD